MRNTAAGYQARNMAAPRKRYGMGAAGQSVSWSGMISPIPGYSPDNSDQWTQYFINLVTSALAPSFSNVSIFVDPVDGTGTQTMHVSGTQAGGGDPQTIITNAVSGAGTNLDLGSVQSSGSDSSIAMMPTNAIQFTGDSDHIFQPPQSILGNPSINSDGTVTLPPSMTIDYTAPAAPPMAVVVLPTKGTPTSSGSVVPIGRGGTVPVRSSGPLPLDDGPGSIKQLPVNVLPDVPPPPPNSVLQVYTPPPIPVVVQTVAPDNLYDPASGILPSDFTGRATDSPVNAGTRIDWAGYVSPISGDYWTQVILGNVQLQLAQQFANPVVSVDPVNPAIGVQNFHVSATTTTSYNNLQQAADIITGIVAGQNNLDHGSVNFQVGTNAGQPVPVVVTTSTSVPLPTVPIPVVGVTNQNDPYYIPTATSGGGIGVGVPPASPDPTSTVMPGTPLVTPTLPAPTTTVTTPAGLTTPVAQPGLLDSTINIFGIQIPVILLVGIGGLLLFSGSSSKR